MIAMHKTAVIGDGNWVLAFKSIGFDTVISTDPMRDIRKLVREEYAVIFIEENLAAQAKDLIDEYKVQPFPMIIPIPGVREGEHTGLGLEEIRQNVIRVFGKDTLSIHNEE